MEIQAAFGIGGFDSTQEIWKKAIENLCIQNIDGRTPSSTNENKSYLDFTILKSLFKEYF